MSERLINLILDEPIFLERSSIFTIRLRIARNIKRYPFPHQMNEKQAERLVQDVADAIGSFVDEWYLIVPMIETDRMIRQLMVERHIISHEFAEDGFGKTLVWLPSLGLRILVNEEDHLRICCYKTCENSSDLWKILDNFDNKLSEKLEYAFDREFGYLTSCPTNLGTGLRISSITFLPALKRTGKIKKIFDTIYRLGCIIRGFYGEGSPSIGNFYQIATGNTLGKTEIEICESFDAVMDAIEEQEKELLNCINISSVTRNIKIFLNKIFGGTLQKISFEQAISGISLLLFGKKLGIIQVEENMLRRLIYRIMPVSLQIEAGMHLKDEEQNVMRLAILKKEIRSLYV